MKKKSGLSYSNFYYYLLLIAPLFLIYIVFFVVPVVSSLFLSMTNYNGLSLDVKFTGLNNYIVAFSDKVFRKAMWNTPPPNRPRPRRLQEGRHWRGKGCR